MGKEFTEWALSRWPGMDNDIGWRIGLDAGMYAAIRCWSHRDSRCDCLLCSVAALETENEVAKDLLTYTPQLDP